MRIWQGLPVADPAEVADPMRPKNDGAAKASRQSVIGIPYPAAERKRRIANPKNKPPISAVSRSLTTGCDRQGSRH
jgi:hypothetical protein